MKLLEFLSSLFNMNDRTIPSIDVSYYEQGFGIANRITRIF